jgi:hypothetical protein
MPISPQLQASARAAYRSIFRAAGSTFSGELVDALEMLLTQHTKGDPEILRGMQRYLHSRVTLIPTLNYSGSICGQNAQ